MKTALFLVLEPGKYGATKIVRISRRCPALKKPTEQAILKLNIDLPDHRQVFKPREVTVEIKPEHIATPKITVTPEGVT